MTSAPRLVKPQATSLLWPITTPGMPAKVKPETSNWQAGEAVRQCRPIWYQTEGRPGPRCGSLASSGLPVVVWFPATTQELEPMPWPGRPSSCGIPSIRSVRPCSSALVVAAPWAVAVPWPAPGCGEPSAGR